MRKIAVLLYALCSFTNMFAAANSCTLTVNPTSSQTICYGQTVMLSANASGGTQPYTYQWSNGYTYPSIGVLPASDTTFYVTVTDSAGCTVISNNIVITVIPPLYLSLITPAHACYGDTVSIRADVSGGSGSPLTYQWTPNIGSGAGPHVFAATASMDITLTVTDNGCVESSSFLHVLTVYSKPVASFSGTPLAGSWPLRECFTDLSTDSAGGIVQWIWDFGDGSLDSAVYNACHDYDTPGSYNVSLCVSTIHGCSSCDTRTNYVNVTAPIPDGIKVYPDPFTDHLTIETSYECQLTLFDYTGNEVFRAKTYVGSSRIDTRDIHKGVYLLRMENGNTVRNFKVIKAR
jgi:PKD repeat protein